MKTKIKQILREGLVMEQRIRFDIPIPRDIQQIQNIFKKNGYKLYVVGGAVRDALLGKTPKDYDLATDAVPDMVEDMMNKAGLRTLPTGKAFGVINVFTDLGEYEIATFREDLGSGRRPEGVSFTNIEGDVKRRDLTINALFFDIDTKEIVDLVGGVEDLKNGVVRTVGAAQDRFGEDRLRILRAIRFAGRFGSGLDPDVDAALQQDASLEGISGERIRDEFIKGLISAKSTDAYLLMLDKYKLFDWLFPSLNVDRNVFRRNADYKYDDYLIVLARLLKGNNVEVLRKKLNELKYSADEIKGIVFLISMLKLDVNTAYLLKKIQQTSGISDDQIRYFGANEGIPSQLLDAFEAFKLSVTGPEAMAKFNIGPGPELGKAIQQMETDNFKKLLG
jgi:tRNA nucleotidyltransferase/poly(A) polymerase